MPLHRPDLDWPAGNDHGLELQECACASRPDRPVIIFAPGFLTECDPAKPYQLIEWREQLQRVAHDLDYAACILFWPSKQLGDLLGAVMPSFLARLAPLGAGVGLLSALGLPVLALRLGVGLGALLRVRDVWKAAVAEADATGKRLAQLAASPRRPVLLAGHSLGGRLVLRAAIESPTDHYQAVHALAPAVTLEPWDLRLAAASVSATSRLAIFHSDADLVLRVLYRLGEVTAAAPLGYAGPPGGLEARIKAIDCSASGLGHLDYATQLASLMRAQLS